MGIPGKKGALALTKERVEEEIEALDLPPGRYTNADVVRITLRETAKSSFYQAEMKDGKKFRFRRVSTVLKTLGGRKTDNLINWGVREAIGVYKERLRPRTTYTKTELACMHKDAEKARFRTSKDALDVGTLVHEFIEQFLHTKQWPDLSDQDHRVQNGFQLFREWWTNQELYVLDCELYVYDCRYSVAGTLDFLCCDGEGRVFVWDWKTSKGIYDEYLLQVAAYAGLLTAMKRYPPPEGVGILRIGKDDAAFQPYIFEQREWLHHYKAFLRLNALYEWQADAEKRLKKNWHAWRDVEDARRYELAQLEAQQMTEQEEAEAFEFRGGLPSGEVPF